MQLDCLAEAKLCSHFVMTQLVRYSSTLDLCLASNLDRI